MSTISSTASSLGSINSATQGTVSLGTGLISGLPISQLVSSLIAIDAEPMNDLKAQVTNLTTTNTDWQGLAAQLQALETAASSFSLASTFQAATATSSNSAVLTATAANGAAAGSYLFTPVQLATNNQLISTGWANSDSAPVGAGTVTLDLGHGQLDPPTALSALNGGAGVPRGQILVTDRAGHSATIDLTNAQTVADVTGAINAAGGIDVTASVHGDSIVLTDTSGGAGHLSVAEVNNGSTAAGLGLVQSVNSNTLTGSDVLSVNASTQLSLLNDGNGVRTTGSQGSQGGADLNITLADGSSLQVAFANPGTVGDVISQINSAQGNNGRVVASIDSTGEGLQLTDTTSGSGSTTVAEVGSGHTAADLGLLGVSDSGNHVLDGNPLMAGLNSVLLRDLNGQAGLTGLGTVSIQDRAGGSATVNLSAAQSAQDVIDAINSATGVSVHAALNAAGDGISVTDTSGGSTRNFQIADSGGGQTAEKLNLATDSAATAVNSGNLSLRYVSENTTLASAGVAAGKFVITNSSGQSATIDLTSASVKTLGDVIGLINSSGLNVAASIDASGAGLLLTDNAGGAGQMTVAESGSTTASDLGILGPAASGQIDGTQRISINVSSSDTLSSVAAAINKATDKVTATVINDGSAGSPYRLVLSSNQAGTAGQITVDGGATGLNSTFATLTKAQDALAYLGNPADSTAVAIHPTGNTITGVIPNVTLTLSGTSSSPVQVTVAPSIDTLVSQLQSFTTALDSTLSQLASLTSYDATTSTSGPLLGNGTASQIQEQLFSLINQPVSGVSGRLNSLLQLGFSVSANGTSITFDASAFRAAYAANPTGVQTLFTQATTGIGARTHTLLDNLSNAYNGTIQTQVNGNDSQITDMNQQIAQMQALLDSKQTLLTQQFTAMEQGLATMQSQAEALNSMLGTSSTSTTSSSTSTTNPLSSLFNNLDSVKTSGS